MAGRNKKRKDRGNDRRFGNAKYNKVVMGMVTKISIVTMASIGIILLAYMYNKYKLQHASNVLEETLVGLLREESSAKPSPGTKIAIGFGSCQDIVVQSNQVVYDRPPKVPEHHFSIANKEEFLEVFSFYYRHGAAAERFVTNSTFFEELVHLAEKAPSARYIIGGNAPVMAKRFVEEGIEHVLLGAQMSRSLEAQFPKNIKISGPFVDEDDIHLLLEYPAGQRWGNFIPVRANRFIIHNDHQNPELSSFDTFAAQMENYKPNLLVVGGLQMMDNFPMQERKRRDTLRKVQNLMKKQQENVRIHFEMASFSDEDLFRDLVQNIVPYADSLGMNEQELPNLLHMLKYGNISLVAESRPRVAVILDEMREVFKFLQQTSAIEGARKLTRLHVHTLAFQAFLTDKKSPWKNTKAAAAKSALVANRHTCGSKIINTEKAKLIMDESFSTSLQENAGKRHFDVKDPIACWDEGTYEVCVAPVLVCTDVLQTGGGGDNISSAGLVLQV